MGCSLGNISRESPGRGVFLVIANGNQYPRLGEYPFPDRGGGGVQVMENEHRYALGLCWEEGGGGARKSHVRQYPRNEMGRGYTGWQYLAIMIISND